MKLVDKIQNDLIETVTLSPSAKIAKANWSIYDTLKKLKEIGLSKNVAARGCGISR